MEGSTLLCLDDLGVIDINMKIWAADL